MGDDRDVDERRKLFIGGLSWDTTDTGLSDAFSKYGRVIEGQLCRPRQRDDRWSHFGVFPKLFQISGRQLSKQRVLT